MGLKLSHTVRDFTEGVLVWFPAAFSSSFQSLEGSALCSSSWGSNLFRAALIVPLSKQLHALIKASMALLLTRKYSLSPPSSRAGFSFHAGSSLSSMWNLPGSWGWSHDAVLAKGTELAACQGFPGKFFLPWWRCLPFLSGSSLISLQPEVWSRYWWEPGTPTALRAPALALLCLALDFPFCEKKTPPGTSLGVQWLGLWASTAGAQVRSLVRELRSHMPQGATKKQKKKDTLF